MVGSKLSSSRSYLLVVIWSPLSTQSVLIARPLLVHSEARDFPLNDDEKVRGLSAVTPLTSCYPNVLYILLLCAPFGICSHEMGSYKINLFNDMDNGAYNKDPEKGTELLEQKEASKSSQKSPKQGKKVSQTQTQTNGSSGIQTDPQTPATSCRPDVCQAARARYAPPDLSGGPWHRKKTIFLGITLGSLILWIIIYSTLSKMNLL